MPLLVALMLFFVITFVWPVVRLRARTGEWALVSHRGADPCQKLVGVLLGSYLVAVVGWAIALALVGPASRGVRASHPAVGWPLVAAGLLLVVAAQAQMGLSWRIGIDDRPTSLVTGGVFAVVRNPIFGGMLLSLAGLVALSLSAATAVAWVAMAQLIFVQVRLEEEHLHRLHGAAYAGYASRVGRFVPLVGRIALSGG